MNISLENWLRNKLQENEEMHDYAVATETVRYWIDDYKQLNVSNVVGSADFENENFNFKTEYNMKTKTSIYNRTFAFAYVLLAVVLFLANCFFVWMAIPEIERYYNDSYAPIVALGCVLYVALTTVAVFKYYR